MVTLCKLVACEEDTLGYITYVFENLEDYMIKQSKYVLVTRFPNWDHRKIDLGEVGYLNFLEVQAGVDKWFDGNKMIPYKYSGCHFIKFVEKPDPKDYKYII